MVDFFSTGNFQSDLRTENVSFNMNLYCRNLEITSKVIKSALWKVINNMYLLILNNIQGVHKP